MYITGLHDGYIREAMSAIEKSLNIYKEFLDRLRTINGVEYVLECNFDADEHFAWTANLYLILHVKEKLINSCRNDSILINIETYYLGQVSKTPQEIYVELLKIQKERNCALNFNPNEYKFVADKNGREWMNWWKHEKNVCEG